MKFQEISVLLPCHSLEDFPVHQEGDEAEGLLASWTALWHPALIAAAAQAPTWHRVDDPPETFEHKLIIIPAACQSQVQAGWAERAVSEGACVIRGKTKRSEILAEALAALDGGDAGADPELIADFLALGFGYLQVELLTRQMRYSSYVDEVYFQNEVTAGAIAVMDGDRDDAESHLHSCFDILSQARDQFYPVESYMIDLTLVAPTTMGAALRAELEREAPLNLLLSGETLQRMADEQPETLAALKTGVDRGHVCLVGGEYSEEELPLLPMEQILAQLQRGRETYQQHLNHAPTVFGRRRFGLCPQLPQILSRMGFGSALHLTLDDGRFPLSEQAKCRWEGHDSSTIDCLAKTPLDVSQPGSFINLSHRLGDTMDHDHVATILFARWPGQTSDWYEDIRRIAARGPALGKFIKLDEYFANTDTPDRLVRFEADEYQSPYLRQAVSAKQPDPISRYVALHRQQARTDALHMIEQLAQLVRPKGDQKSTAELKDQLSDAVVNFAAATSGRDSKALEQGNDSNVKPAGTVVVNPFSNRMRAGVNLSDWPTPPAVVEPIRAVGQQGDTSQAVIDVPACGFVFVQPATTPSKEKASKEPPLAAENILQNEHIEVTINPETGSIHSLREHNVRGNLLSQQVAFRASSLRPRGVVGDFTPPEDPYTIMAADSMEVTCATKALGEIVTHGRLLDREGNRIAGFSQKYQLWRGSRIVLVGITLTPDTLPGPDPWDSYYGVRFAWGDDDAHLWRSVGSTAHPNVVPRFEAPHFIDLRCDAAKLTVLTGGLPFHQRTGDRRLETLLMVRGETANTFQMGIGVNIGSPLPAAMELMTPQQELLAPVSTPPATHSAWLWHLDTRQVSITWMEAIIEDGRAVGCKLRILETTGRPGNAKLKCFKSLTQAKQTDYLGGTLCELRVTEGEVQLDFAAYEWVQLETRWEGA